MCWNEETNKRCRYCCATCGMPQLTPDHPSRPINTTSLRPQPCPLFPYAGPGPIMPTLSPIRHARHDVYDYDQFPSDIEPSCSTSCSRTSSPSPSPDYFGLSLSPPFSPSDFQRQKNADCTSEDGYADDDFAFGLWARPHPRHFTEIDPLSVHEVEVRLPFPRSPRVQNLDNDVLLSTF